MSKKFPYTYSVLRYRHDPLANEQVNVGLLFHCPGARIAEFQIRDTMSRFRAMYPDLDAEAFKETLRSIQRSVSKIADSEGAHLFANLNDADSLARRALVRDASSFVWGDQGAGLTSDPTAQASSLFERFVALYDKERRALRQDSDVWRPVKEMLVSRNLARHFQTKVIASDLDKVEFEHAWKNGSWHVYEPLSFDLSSEEYIKEKARRWVGQLTTVARAENFTPHFVVGKPSAADLMPAYKAALKILAASPIQTEIIEENNIERLVDQIEVEMGEHNAH